MKDNRPFLWLRDPKEPLTLTMDNVLAWRLGEAGRAAAKKPGGDLIDRGLALLHELHEHGFDVIVRLPAGNEQASSVSPACTRSENDVSEGS